MSSEFERVELAFHAVLQRITTDSASSALDAICGTDSALRQRVELRLDSHQRSPTFFNGPASDDLAGRSRTVDSADEQTERLGMAESDYLSVTNAHHHSQSNPASPVNFPGDGRIASSKCLETVFPERRLGDYKILQFIGSGGMGLVFKAHDTRLDREVAIKVMKLALASDPAARKRFVLEARSAAKVIHPNVVTIHAVHEFGDMSCLVMEYVRGWTLYDQIRRGPMEIREIVRIGHQIALGLVAAHKRSIVHRDVKPANVLILEDDLTVKITDFGLACAIAESDHSQPGLVTGTPKYMSPEQTQGHRVDHRSDLFSLGSVLYELCTGESAFLAQTVMAVIHQVANVPHVPISQKVPGRIPDWLITLIDRLMEKRPEDRIQSAAAVVSLLERGSNNVLDSDIVANEQLPLGRPSLLRRKGWRPATFLWISFMIFAAGNFVIPTRDGELEIRTDDRSKETSKKADSAVTRDSGKSLYAVSSAIPLTWEPAEKLGLVNSRGYDAGAFACADGLSLLFHTHRQRMEAQGPVQIWQSRRSAVNEPFGEPVRLDDVVNTTEFVSADPSMSADGLLLAFSSDRPNGVGGLDLWIASRPDVRSPWEAVVNLGILVNSVHSEWEPEITADGLAIYYHSDRKEGFGGTDLWVAKRPSRDVPFEVCQNLGAGVNSSDNDGGAALSADGKSLLFHRVAGQTVELWRATRQSVSFPFENCLPVRIRHVGEGQPLSPALSSDGNTLYFNMSHSDSDGMDLWQSRHMTPDYALDFNGTSDHVEIPSLSRDQPNTLTIEAWVCVKEKCLAPTAILVVGGRSRAELAMAPEHWFAWDDSQDKCDLGSPEKSPVTIQRWVHFAYVLDEATAQLFIDGAEVAIMPATTHKLLETPIVKRSWVGGHPQGASLEVRYCFPGRITEARISKSARYKSPFVPALRWQSDSDTLALYHFDESVGDVLKDSSGNNHIGRIVGAKWVEVTDLPQPAARQPAELVP